MHQLIRDEILDAGTYERVRDAFRQRVIEAKKLRRVALGTRASCLFENRQTVFLQIHEMLRAEKITRRDAIDHELETYNRLIPGPSEISATIMIEIDDKAEREAFLEGAVGLEGAFGLMVGGEHVRGVCGDRGGDATRTTAIHYVKFPLSAGALTAMRRMASGDPTVGLLTVFADHRSYHAEAALTAALSQSLAAEVLDLPDA